MRLAPSALRQPGPDPEPDLGPAAIDLSGLGLAGVAPDPKGEAIRVEFPDGSVSINLAPPLAGGANPEDANKHDENLALHVDEGSLGGIASDLLRLIEQDRVNQDKRLNDIAEGLKLLGLEYEPPRTEPGEEGLSVVRHPGLLEAVLQFQANCRGEMLPVDGPVKARDDGEDSTQQDVLSDALQKDMNHYLTVGAPEYYPDTDRMFFSLGFGGESYKKVYLDPIKQRPVSMTVDRKDLILSDGAVSLEDNKRVTHRLSLTPSTCKRMQIAGVWRDAPLGLASPSIPDAVEQALENIAGVASMATADPYQVDRTIYECYCELDLPGFPHKDDDGVETGLPLPYRVTLDKDSQQVLEVRRWWREDDKFCLRREVFVEYVFVPGPGGLNIGLFHIMGNSTRALTAAWRIALDNGMYANFPGFLYARAAGRQQTTNLRVAPGGGTPVDTGDMSLKDAVMPLPYRDISPGFFQLMNMIQQENEKAGSTASLAVGEGRQDVPVGTMLAMVEQATKVLSSVHKRMHSSQQKEFLMLKELFKEEPDSLWIRNKKPNVQGVEQLKQALEDDSIVPAADPNTASHMMRIQKAIALAQRSDAHPDRYDGMAVEKKLLATIGFSDWADLLAKGPPQGPGPDPVKIAEAQAKTTTANANLLKARVQAADTALDAQNRAADRESRERQAILSLARTSALHPEAMTDAERLAKGGLFPGTPTGGEGPI